MEIHSRCREKEHRGYSPIASFKISSTTINPSASWNQHPSVAPPIWKQPAVQQEAPPCTTISRGQKCLTAAPTESGCRYRLSSSFLPSSFSSSCLFHPTLFCKQCKFTCTRVHINLEYSPRCSCLEDAQSQLMKIGGVTRKINHPTGNVSFYNHRYLNLLNDLLG